MRKTIGVVISKDPNSEGYPKVENGEEHKEYLERIYRAIGTVIPWEHDSKSKKEIPSKLK